MKVKTIRRINWILYIIFYIILMSLAIASIWTNEGNISEHLGQTAVVFGFITFTFGCIAPIIYGINREL